METIPVKIKYLVNRKLILNRKRFFKTRKMRRFKDKRAVEKKQVDRRVSQRAASNWKHKRDIALPISYCLYRAFADLEPRDPRDPRDPAVTPAAISSGTKCSQVGNARFTCGASVA